MCMLSFSVSALCCLAWPIPPFRFIPFSMPHIFHVMDVSHMSWHMLLGRPWIHDHRCVPSSWHQCIKAAPFKTGQVWVRGLKNPFAIEEAHFYEASYFIEPNILTMARKNEYTSNLAIIDLPSHVKLTANYPPKLPPKKWKLNIPLHQQSLQEVRGLMVL